ncbi:MAG: xylose isomerase [Caldisericaceae bacterium]|nr:xylose isomerase [Caldisericaceae bacterium]
MPFFPEVSEPIPFEGKASKNPLAFKYYDSQRKIGSKTMSEHLRFSVAYWHTLMGNGQDMFGAPSFVRPWHIAGGDPMDRAKATMDAAFEFFQKLGVKFYCFHDRDIAPEGATFAQTCKNLENMALKAKELQKSTGIKLLWGTANLFSNPIYAHGAATSPDAHVFAHAAAQVKHAIDITHELGGENYVFWGGREGYETILNTNFKHEQEQLARFLHMAVDYKKKIGFKGQFLIEPKPKEPTKHQYDTDAATTLAFLREYDLIDHFKLNIEANHATLAGHTFEHELVVASAVGKLGSVDANRGDLLLGWDTDQFPIDLYSTALAMYIILKQGGLGSGGLNFDAKVRRPSIETVDLFYAHIGGMDAFARGLIIANNMLNDGIFDEFLEKRYSSYRSGFGELIMEGKATLEQAEQFIHENGLPKPFSGRQEYLEKLLNDYIE